MKNEEEVLENLEAATFLNDFYINVGPSLAQKQNKKWDKEKSKIKIEISFSFSWVPGCRSIKIYDHQTLQNTFHKRPTNCS